MKRLTINFTAYLSIMFSLIAFAGSDVYAQKKKPAKAQPASVPIEVLDDTPPVKPSQAKICVATPKTNLAPAESSAQSLHSLFISYLSGPAAEIVPLTSMVMVQQQAEAAEKGCGFFLTASMKQKKKGGGEGWGRFLKNTAGAAPLLNDIGANKTAQTISTAANRSASKMETAGNLAVTIKAKDEVTLDYSLFNVNTNAVAAGKIKAKAGKEGEDILTPMLEQSVNEMLAVVLKK